MFTGNIITHYWGDQIKKVKPCRVANGPTQISRNSTHNVKPGSSLLCS